MWAASSGVECGGKAVGRHAALSVGICLVGSETNLRCVPVPRRCRRFALPPHSKFDAGHPHELPRAAVHVAGIAELRREKLLIAEAKS